jgi:hypothetical protein
VRCIVVIVYSLHVWYTDPVSNLLARLTVVVVVCTFIRLGLNVPPLVWLPLANNSETVLFVSAALFSTIACLCLRQNFVTSLYC